MIYIINRSGLRFPSPQAGRPALSPKLLNRNLETLKDWSRCKVTKVSCKCISNAVANISCKRGLEVLHCGQKRCANNVCIMYGPKQYVE